MDGYDSCCFCGGEIDLPDNVACSDCLKWKRDSRNARDRRLRLIRKATFTILALLAMALVIGVVGCTTITYSTLECEAHLWNDTIPVKVDDYLTIKIDSITFTPEEYSDYCEAKWIHDFGPLPQG